MASTSFSPFVRRPLAWSVAALWLWLVLLCAADAAAQERTFYLDRVQVSGAPDDGLIVWRPYMAEKTRFFGAATLGYTLNPLHADTVTNNEQVADRIENPMRHQFILHLSGGIEIANRVMFGLTLPIALYQAGGEDPVSEGVGGGLQRDPVALHDLRIDARLKLLESGDRKFRLGIGSAVFAPTGNIYSFAGDDEATWFLYGNAEYDFGTFLLAGHAGPHFRPDRGIGGAEGDLDVGTELRWAIGAFVPIREGDVRLGGTLWGSTGLVKGRRSGESTFLGGNNTDLEWLAEVRMWVDKESHVYFNGGGGTRLSDGYGSPDIRLLAQIGIFTGLSDTKPGSAAGPRRKAPQVAMHDVDSDGDGYPDDIDMCPKVKEDGAPPDPSDGCPAAKDRDKDGIPDDEDKCPDKPEDKDGIQDSDGCPETDADSDGILDKEDACPTVGGVKSKDPKQNGCPRKGRAILETNSEVQLLEPIQFDFGKTTIKPVSYPILDEVVDVLKSRPDARMAVYGHTDNKGSRDLNMRLSRDRAASVMNYLASKGIARNRLESEGFGPDKPIAPNDTDEGRAKNRRVEFKILEK